MITASQEQTTFNVVTESLQKEKKISVDVSVHLKVQGCCCLGPVRVDNEGPSNSPSASLCFDIYFLCGRGEILQLETSRTTDKHGLKTQAAVQLC